MGGEGLTSKKPEFVRLVDANGNDVSLIGQGFISEGQADKSAFTEGTTKILPIGGVRNDAPVGDVAEDAAAAPRITPKRALHVNVRDNDGVEVDVRALLEAVRDRLGDAATDDTVIKELRDLQGLVDGLEGFVDGVEALLAALVATDFATDTTLAAVRDRLPSALRAGRLDAADTFTNGEVLADQAGAGAALTFTFAAPQDLIWVRSDGGDARADPFGGTPDATTGIFCEDGIPQPVTVRAATVKVFAAAGVTVHAWGYRYS